MPRGARVSYGTLSRPTLTALLVFDLGVGLIYRPVWEKASGCQCTFYHLSSGPMFSCLFSLDLILKAVIALYLPVESGCNSTLNLSNASVKHRISPVNLQLFQLGVFG